MTDDYIKCRMELCGSKAEINRLEYTLMGVMHSVDKWLDGDELKQNEVDRAATMREKTLQIVEEKEAEIERLNTYLDVIGYSTDKIKAEAVKEFAERLKAEKFTHRNFGELVYVEDIDNLVKEFTEGEKK